MLGWWMVAAWAAPCDLDNGVVAAYGALLTRDVAAAQAALEQAERDLSCARSFAEPEELGRFWLVEGALLAEVGDPDASLSFAAARRVAPDLWLDKLSARSRKLWEEALASEGTGTILLDVRVEARSVALDGQLWTELGSPVPAGLHALQVAEPDGKVVFGAMIYVGASTVTNVSTGLPPENPLARSPEPPAPVPVPVPPSGRGLSEHLDLVFFTGASLALGERLGAPLGEKLLEEPAVKLVLPVMVAGRVRGGRWWGRLETGAGWLVGGPYLGVTADGRLHRTPVRLDVGLGGGAAVGPLDVGLSSGIQWPGRLAQRVVASLPGAGKGPLFVEARGGFNLATDRPIEPGMELLVGLSLP